MICGHARELDPVASGNIRMIDTGAAYWRGMGTARFTIVRFHPGPEAEWEWWSIPTCEAGIRWEDARREAGGPLARG